MNMNHWMESVIHTNQKKPFPLLSYPSVQYLYVTVKELVCGSAVNRLIPQLMETGCRAFHFGESADMALMLEKLPGDYLILGNISPSAGFNNNTPDGIDLMTRGLLERCRDHRNFVPSSGCDIPPGTDLDNISAFFDTVDAYYYRQHLFDMVG